MVFVLDRNNKPIMPCSEKRARLLLQRRRARVHRLYPFTIRLTDRARQTCALQPIALKLDPGSKTTGIAIVREDRDAAYVLFLAELEHRGGTISESLTKRKGYRRRRRSVNLRYRQPRFNNRTRPDGWLAPSLRHRIETTISWVRRLTVLAPITALAQELVRFDLQQMANPKISGVEYQQGTLAGYEVREYLLEKWNRTCAYCDAKDAPLQIEHVMPRSRGGSNRISNLTLACGPCNNDKANRSIEEFLAHDSVRLRQITAQLKAPRRDASAVNSTRWALFRALTATDIPVTTGSGGRTKFNRSRLNIPKTHALDALCVGNMGDVFGWHVPTMVIKAAGRGSYQRTRVTKYGFPRGHLTRQKRIHEFQTGDMVRADIPLGKKAGIHIGRVAVRATGSFNIQTPRGVIQGISHRHCRTTHRADGYGYSFIAPPTKGSETRGHATHGALSLSGLNAGVSRATYG